MIEGANQLQWDYLAFGAKDNVESRMSLYTRIAQRIAAQLHLEAFVYPNPNIVNAIVVASPENMQKLKQDVGIE